MYAQYNQHYQHSGGAVATNGMVWNGSAWMAAGAPRAALGGQIASGQQGYGKVAAVDSGPSLVAKYTDYYHRWTARAQEYEEKLKGLSLSSPERAEAVSARDWSKYYADQSSRAAHHYHANPSTPAPFELPPEPPSSSQQHPTQQAQTQSHAANTSSNLAKKTSRWSDKKPASAPAAASTDGPPDGLKRYVHRCLEQCTTAEQRKSIEQETEKLIAAKLQNGTLHTTNWDATPLITVPGVAVSGKREYYSPNSVSHYGQADLSPQSSKKQKLSSDSYYGPSSAAGGAGVSQVAGNNHNNKGQSAGYYGPASSSPSNINGTLTSSSQPSHHSYYQQQPAQSKYGYYGNQDFIAVPQIGKKNSGKKSNKYVNPSNNKYTKPNAADGFQRSSTALAKRASRFSGPGGNSDVRYATAKGIDDRYMGKGVIGGSAKKLDEMDYEQMKVKGTCMTLAKDYLRLTAPPKAELVRPLEILQLHLKNLKAEWESPNRRDYLWFCSQLKACRQDLTVQHITTAFTVDVYQTHARIALQSGDLNEFNQAQTQLKILYSKLADDPKAVENQNEFVAYLLLYLSLLLYFNEKYTGGSSDLLNLIASLTDDQKKDPAIKHALKVRATVAEVDFHSFFRLQKSCPNLGGKLMELMVPTVRHWALQRICKAFRPAAETLHVLAELGWNVDEPSELDDGKKYLVSCGCVLNDDTTQIKTKDSVVRESDLVEKRSLI